MATTKAKMDFTPKPISEALRRPLQAAAKRIQLWYRCNGDMWKMNPLVQDAAIEERLLPFLNAVEDLRASDAESRVEQIAALRAWIVEAKKEKAVLRDKLQRSNASRKKLERYRKAQGIPITPIKVTKEGQM